MKRNFGLALMLISLATTSSFAVAADFGDAEKKVLDLIQKDLSALEALQFSRVSPLHSSVFGDANGHSLVKYITNRTREFQVTTLPKGVEARAADGILQVDESYLKKSQVLRWYTLIHESTHNEISTPDHVLCPNNGVFVFNNVAYNLKSPRNTLPGSLACDDKVFGAYGIGYIFTQSILESCLNCSKEMKGEALQVGLTYGLLRISEPVSAEALVMKSSVDPATARLRTEKALKFFEAILSAK